AGGTACFSGAHTLGAHASAVGPAAATADGAAGEGVVAAGNLLASEGVPAAMVAAFTGATGELEQRLVAALAAGLAAGGEAGPVRSAGLAVVADVAWRVTDLRVDWHDDPVGELARLVALWLPQRDDYVSRALAPSSAPSYGVPGDE
ncbi:MAG: fimbrial assembly protein FimA, partial [Pseudonocardia sp.]|nr:fimbrial assembly protein FimA [Pseudonocardia sp.]